MSNGKLLKKNPMNLFSCNVCCVLVIVLVYVKVFFFLVTFDSLVMFCLDYGHIVVHTYIAIYSQNTKVMWK